MKTKTVETINGFLIVKNNRMKIDSIVSYKLFKHNTDHELGLEFTLSNQTKIYIYDREFKNVEIEDVFQVIDNIMLGAIENTNVK